MRYQVMGIGWVTPAGYGQRAEVQHFSMVSGALPKLDQHDFFGMELPRFGRLDAYTRLGLAAIALALKDAKLDAWEEKRPIGLVSSSETGCLETDAQYFHTVLSEEGRFSSPNLFAYTLPNCMLGEASICFGLTGPVFVVQEARHDLLAGLRAGLGMLAADLCDTVAAGVCNAPPPERKIPFIHPSGAVFFVLRRRMDGELGMHDDVLCWKNEPVFSLESLMNLIGQTRQIS